MPKVSFAPPSSKTQKVFVMMCHRCVQGCTWYRWPPLHVVRTRLGSEKDGWRSVSSCVDGKWVTVEKGRVIMTELWIRASRGSQQNPSRHHWHFGEEEFQNLHPRILEKADNTSLQEGVPHGRPKPRCRKSVSTFSVEREENKQEGISPVCLAVIFEWRDKWAV